jgi:uncharacterized surface protein with fasciclin (FAS1) repeats
MFYKKLIGIVLTIMLALGVIGVMGIPNAVIDACNDTMAGNVTVPDNGTVTGPNTMVNITSTPSGVYVGDMFDLTVTEENTGDEPLTDPWVWVGGMDPATGLIMDMNIANTEANGWGMGKDNAHYVSGDTNDDGIQDPGETWGDTNNDGILDPGETWTWVIPDLQPDAVVIIIAKGHGMDSGNNDVAWPEYPMERNTIAIHQGNGTMPDNIVDLAAADGRFETLVTALDTAGLDETLRGEGLFTVFAPTDDAFDALPEGTLDDLLADPQALGNVLLYHVIEGELMEADLVEMTEAETLEGQSVTISASNGDVMVNDANIVEPNIMASNGVIQVIDTVLIP